MLGTPQEFSHFELHTEVAEETRYDREILEDIRICMQEEENIDVTWAGAVFFGACPGRGVVGPRALKGHPSREFQRHILKEIWTTMVKAPGNSSLPPASSIGNETLVKCMGSISHNAQVGI